jgi:hypothetical protein
VSTTSSVSDLYSTPDTSWPLRLAPLGWDVTPRMVIFVRGCWRLYDPVGELLRQEKLVAVKLRHVWSPTDSAVSSLHGGIKTRTFIEMMTKPRTPSRRDE